VRNVFPSLHASKKLVIDMQGGRRKGALFAKVPLMEIFREKTCQQIVPCGGLVDEGGGFYYLSYQRVLRGSTILKTSAN
jgi:hypothetical protein